jgi:molecular chaperone DnaK
MTQQLSAPLKESVEPEPVSLRFRFDSETVEQFAERYASDVSRGGIFVHARQPFPVGTSLRLDLQLLDGTPLIVGEGTVVWTREPDPNKPATVPGMGIRFSKLTGHSQQVIDLVLLQRTGRERSGLFPTLSASVTVEESGRILNNNPRSKLPFNIFPGRSNEAAAGGKPADERELLASAGREETTPLVGVSAATLADARPGIDEAAASRTPQPIALSASASGAPATGSGVHKRPPLSLIKPGSVQARDNNKDTKEAQGTSNDASGPHRRPTPVVKAPSGAHRTSSGMNAIPAAVTAPEILKSGSVSIPPAPVQGEPALEASPTAVGRPIDSGPIAASGLAALTMSSASISMPITGTTPTASLRPPMRNKLILGAAALLAAGLTIFAATRHPSTVSPEGQPMVRASATSTGVAATTANALSSETNTGNEPTATMAPSEANPGSALESAAAGAANGKGNGSTRVADRRPAKSKPAAPGHRADPQPAAHTTAAPSERPTVAEPAPRAEPAPSLPSPPPAPVAVARPETPGAPKAIAPIAPPSVATLAHKLRMTSIPSEAEVELDGKVIGKTPLFGVEIDMSRPHVLVVHKDGFAPFRQNISGGADWIVRASENTATLRISALMKKL